MEPVVWSYTSRLLCRRLQDPWGWHTWRDQWRTHYQRNSHHEHGPFEGNFKACFYDLSRINFYIKKSDCEFIFYIWIRKRYFHIPVLIMNKPCISCDFAIVSVSQTQRAYFQTWQVSHAVCTHRVIKQPETWQFLF